MRNENGIYKWQFQPTQQKQDPYESIEQLLLKYSPQDYKALEESEKNKFLDNLILEIRKINIFPIFYFNEEGIKKEIESVIEKQEVCFVNDNLYTKSNKGMTLLDYLFPNLHLAECYSISNNNVYTRFYDDTKLRKCLDRSLSTTVSHHLRTLYFKSSRLYWNTPINYMPIRAKAIYECFCPPEGTIYDYSCGYGGRMFGALTSKNNYTYVGTDPNLNTYYNLKRLGKYIEDVTKRENSFKLYNIPSEQLQLKKDSIDFCFSCPPFYNKEVYSLEDTQSIISYPKYEDWLENYVRPTIKNCYYSLKPTGLYGVDILDYFCAGKKITLVEDWKRIAEEEGFYFRKQYYIHSKYRKKNDENKQSIFIFTKREDTEIKNYVSDINAKLYLTQVESNRNKALRRKNLTIAEYDIFGKLINTYSEKELINKFGKNDEIKKCYKCKISFYDNKYYKSFRGDDIIKASIDDEIKKPICKIDDNYFFSYSEAGKKLGVTRQAVQQSAKRKAKKIKDKEIKWYN